MTGFDESFFHATLDEHLLLVWQAIADVTI